MDAIDRKIVAALMEDGRLTNQELSERVGLSPSPCLRRVRGPVPAIHEVVRWRLIDLMQWVWEEFGISLSEATMSRELKELGYRKVSARPRHHAQNEFAIEDFKKTSPPSWRRSGRASRPGPR